MKSRTLICVTGMMLFIALTTPGPAIPVPDASAPIATVSPTSLTFSTQTIGTRSTAKIVTLTNTGTAILSITQIAITGPNVRDFAKTHTCGSSLAVGASCTIRVKFKPTALGTRSAALSIADNAVGSPQKVALRGTGVAPSCIPIGELVSAPVHSVVALPRFPIIRFAVARLVLGFA